MKPLLSLISFVLLSMSSLLAQPIDSTFYVHTSDNVDLYVHIKGQGQPCLYLHGGPGSGSTWMQDLGGSILEQYYTMIYLDQRGVCKSSSPNPNDASSYTLDRQVEDWETVRQLLGIDSWFLLGHSFGGLLEMGYWQRHSEAIKGMIFMNCTLSMEASFRDSWLPTAIKILGDKVNPKALDTSLPIWDRMTSVFPLLNNDNRWQIFTPNKEANDRVDSWEYHKDCKQHGCGDIVLTIDDYWQDFRLLTSDVSVPVLFFFGRFDHSVGPDFYKGVHFPNAIIVGADCGHFPFLEAPEDLHQALQCFQSFSSH